MSMNPRNSVTVGTEKIKMVLLNSIYFLLVYLCINSFCFNRTWFTKLRAIYLIKEMDLFLLRYKQSTFLNAPSPLFTELKISQVFPVLAESAEVFIRGLLGTYIWEINA